MEKEDTLDKVIDLFDKLCARVDSEFSLSYLAGSTPDAKGQLMTAKANLVDSLIYMYNFIKESEEDNNKY